MLGTTIALSISMTFPIFTTIFSVIIQKTTIPYYYFISMPLVIVGVIVLAIGKEKQNAELIEELRQNHKPKESEKELNNSENNNGEDQNLKPEINDQTKENRKYLLLATFIALLAAVAWGAASVLTEMALTDVSDFLGTSTYSSILGNVVRFPAAAIVLSFMTIPDKKKKIKDWSKFTWLFLIIGSLIGTSLGIYLYNEALVRSNAVFVSIIGASSPLFSIPIAWLINKEKINWLGLIGVILTIAGVVVIFALQLIYGNIQ
jgi:drug/metabolite transporter (DMT)-like permease